MGKDVQEMDAWGMDMYTRRNVFDGGCLTHVQQRHAPKQHISFAVIFNPPSTLILLFTPQ
jgi:hypothetical protein